jgi:CHRD domain-containing protein
MKTYWFVTSAAIALALATIGSFTALGQGSERRFKATLKGLNEVPSISSTGTGQFRATADPADTSLSYELQYANLEGTTTTAAHVHLGQTAVSGGVMFFLCGGGGKPVCPNISGSVTGTVTAADVIGPAGQGVAAGEFAEALRGMRSGASYVNVHTDKHPGGEIRGQINDDASDQ